MDRLSFFGALGCVALLPTVEPWFGPAMAALTWQRCMMGLVIFFPSTMVLLRNFQRLCIVIWLVSADLSSFLWQCGVAWWLRIVGTVEPGGSYVPFAHFAPLVPFSCPGLRVHPGPQVLSAALLLGCTCRCFFGEGFVHQCVSAESLTPRSDRPSLRVIKVPLLKVEVPPGSHQVKS